MKTEGALQQWARRRAVVALYGVLAFIAMVSIWTPLLHREIAERWFSTPNIYFLSFVPLITAVARSPEMDDDVMERPGANQSTHEP